MPSLACNQHCGFCSYGHRLESDPPEERGWKNHALMSDDFMPADKMRELVADWRAMGVKAVEITGGGEPLIWPHIDEFLWLAADWGVDVGLVTNGTALTEHRANRFARTNWKWARVSIDAGTREQYVATRRVSRIQWDQAWMAVERLSLRRRDPEQRVGVGYVVDRTNYDGVYEACRLALERGADNVRVALAFTPAHLNRFPAGALEEAGAQAQKAAHDFAGRLQVNDLVSERANNIAAQVQDYELCAAKEVLCVVGGDQRVYNCCTLAFNPLGLVGSIADRSFRDLWESDEVRAMFAGHDAREVCKVPCLYERRNKRALDLISMTPESVAAIAADDPGIHRNFI
jgi:MoaA/NifB/PqqE/SkfB family radical SAM enzyme